MILAGDVGGTKTQVALCHEQTLEIIERRAFSSQEYPGIRAIIEQFLDGRTFTFEGVCLGVAGPVVDGKSRITNLTWELDAAEIAEAIGCRNTTLINDLEANGYGIAVLPDTSFHTLQPGVARVGNAALISAGTGLGECCLYWNGTHHIPIPSEGGHSSFAPCTDEEIDLLRHALSKHRHVSWERIVSGSMGFASIYSFLRDTGRAPEPPELAADLETGDFGAVIGAAAGRGVDIAVRTMELFARLYGSETGNLALKALATAGVYIGGGIAPKILPWLERGGFLDAFQAKGRFSTLLREIPIRVILDDLTALYGAARHAQLKRTA